MYVSQFITSHMLREVINDMKIIQNQNGGSIIYDKDDWLAGMDTTSSGTDYGVTGGNPFMSEVDPLRKYGFVTTSFNAADVTNIASVTATITKGIVNGDNAYFIGGGLVHKLTTLGGGTISTTAPFPHTIDHAHASESASDICSYYNYNAGTPKFGAFYSFSDATDWDVGFYDYLADTFDDDFMSTVPTSPLAAPYLAGGAGYPHPLHVGDDDILYMGDRNFVHAYDRSNGTFYPAVLTLPKGWIITCFTTTQDLQLAIGTYYSAGLGASTFNRGAAKVWFWSYLALEPDYSRDLGDNYVSEILQWNGTIAAFTQGRRSLVDRGIYKLQILNGSQFEIIKTWNTGGLPVRGGIDTCGKDLYWNGAGSIYAMIKRPDNGQFILNHIVQVGSTGGAFIFLTGSSIYHTSFGSGTGAGLVYFSGNYNEVGILQCQIASPQFPVKQKGELTQVTVKLSRTFTGGRSFELQALLDNSASILIAETSASSDLRMTRISTKSDGTPLGVFNTLQPYLKWSTGSGATDAAEIEWIRFDYQLVNV